LIAAETPRAAPTLEFTTLQGQQVSLADYRGKAVLVMYFSTDCPHCQQAATVMAPIYEDLRSKGVEFLAMAMNPSAKQNLGAFIQKYGVAYPTGFATRAEFARFAGMSLMQNFYFPYFLFVDPEGASWREEQGSNRTSSSATSTRICGRR
jgi:peroxiredoxin